MISPAGLLILTLTLDQSLHDRLKEKTSQRANDGNFMLFPSKCNFGNDNDNSFQNGINSSPVNNRQ